MKKGWLTRQYFSKGKHDLVLPAWLLGILGPSGEGRHGISGLPFLNNTDLRSYIALGSPDSDERFSCIIVEVLSLSRDRIR